MMYTMPVPKRPNTELIINSMTLVGFLLIWIEAIMVKIPAKTPTNHMFPTVKESSITANNWASTEKNTPNTPEKIVNFFIRIPFEDHI